MNESNGALFASELDLRTALEALVIDNPDLDRLEALLAEFNLFEAIGAVRHELRHSDFLAFLLDPQQNHGLADSFVTRLLQSVLQSSEDSLLPITPIGLHLWTLDHIIVLREWQNIDLLLLDELHCLAVIIENKIDASEHSNQLNRYHATVRQHYPDWNILPLYLTPDGALPSVETYLPISYGLICEVIEDLTTSRASTLGADVRTLMVHYTQMLRRHIVSDSEIAELCHRIYQKHRRALDLIFEHRPDRQAEIRALVEQLIVDSGLIPDQSSKTKIRFLPKEWDVPSLQQGNDWTSTRRMLLFQVLNDPKRIALNLFIGPGPHPVRQALIDAARNNQPFRLRFKSLGRKWTMVYDRPLLRSEVLGDLELDEVMDKLRQEWSRFVRTDLPALIAGLTPHLTALPSPATSPPDEIETP